MQYLQHAFVMHMFDWDLLYRKHLHQIDPQDPEHCKDVARRLIRMGADGLETQYCEFDDEWREATEQIAQECGWMRSVVSVLVL